ncbi:MAG TPA: dihydrofolate reductase family protein, partial [Isoptericola sp.]|nr:dihydrofolate reductase family protein [Isoptericola sp.]
LGYWPSVADDADADPRDRAYARWLVDTEKVVLSRTLATAPWPRARVVDAPAADVVRELRGAGGGEILVNSSASVIKPLLAAGLLDRLYLLVVPVLVGGGPRLFDDGLPSSSWTVTRQEAGESGELALVYDRVR